MGFALALPGIPQERLGVAWILLCFALALHVIDEAIRDFLSVYNPSARAIRSRFPFIPMPIFTFRVWLGGLCLATVVLFCLAPLEFTSKPLAIWLAYPFSIIMFANSMGHFGSSLYRRRWMPGVYSSPLLLVAAVYLFICAEAARHAA